MILKLQAMKELLRRYREIWREAWKMRHAMKSPQRLSHELAFLPAHLELQETPVHPAPAWAMRIIIVLLALALAWAIFGKLDIVASATGKVVPNDRVKVVQPLEAGVVRAIYVRDGQQVNAGQVLIELDTIAIDADLSKSEEAHIVAMLAEARADALLKALEQNGEVKISLLNALPEQRVSREEQLAKAQFSEYRSKQAGLLAELARRRAELSTTKELVEKLEQTLPIVKTRAEEYKQLQAEKFVSRHSYLDQEKERINVEKDLSAQRSRLMELGAAINVQERQAQSFSAEFKRQQLDTLNQSRQQLKQLTEDVTKARQRQQLTKLTAPVSGTVQQLAIHTVGGVVTAAQALLVVVPEDTLEIEATVENKDIGFINAGQIAALKIETFPYTRYGYLYGRVLSISSDAVSDEKKGLVYHARIKLESDRLWVDSKWIRLSPGMAVTAEIKTGKRRMIDYVLSPLTENVTEAFRER
jgi:hemolysin D